MINNASLTPRTPESLLIAFLTIWNIGLYRREARLTNLEVVTRIETVLDDIRESGFLELQSIPTTIPTITVARVVRDGQVQTMPFTLLVEGDVLLLAYGDVSPGRMRHIAPPPQATPTPHMTTSAAAAAAAASSSSSSHPIPPAVSSASHPHSHYNTSSPSMQVQNVVIEKGCVLTFDMIASTQNSSLTGFFHFELLETPLVDTLKASLNYSRPETVIIWQIKKLRHFLLSRVVWSVLGLSMLINLIRFSVQYTLFQVSPSASSIPSDSASIASQAIEMLLSFQIYILILLLPLWLPTMCLVARSYGNAQILSLLDALQTSKVQFKDKDDIDEFDAAPPPTKDIATEWRAIAEKFWDQLIRFDVEFLARTTGLIESLANTTVICTVDREGTISMPFPTVDKLFLLSDTGDPVVLDVVELPHSIKFEDQDWEKYLG